MHMQLSVALCYGQLFIPGHNDLRVWWKQDLKNLAKRWLPILNYFDECGVDVCYEIHPGEDLYDGITYEMFLKK